MRQLLRNIDEQRWLIPIDNILRAPGCSVDCLLTGFAGCSRLLLDLCLSGLCAAITGMFVAATLGGSF